MTKSIRQSMAQAEAKAWLKANKGWDKDLSFRSLFTGEDVPSGHQGWNPSSDPVTMMDVLSGQVK